MIAAQVVSVVVRLIEIILSLVPVEEARKLLDDAAVKRANTIADAAELAKFGPRGPSGPGDV